MSRILFVSRISMGHGIFGGMESGFHSLAEGLKNSGCEVSILTTRGIVRADLMQTFDHVWCIPFARKRKYSLLWWIGSMFHRPSVLWYPDLAVSISSAGASFMTSNRGVVTVAQCHGTALAEVRSSIKTGGLREYAKAILNMARIIREVPSYRSFSRIWAVSDEVANQLKSFPYRVPNEKIEVIPNGVDVEEFAFRSSDRVKIRNELNIPIDAQVGITLCRLVAQKGVDVAINSLLEGPANDRILIVAGDGPEREALCTLALTAGVLDRLRFLGNVEKSRISAHLSAADVFVFPTRRLEGLPFSLLEALANGLPVLTTDGCNVPMDINDYVVISEGSPESIAKAWTDTVELGKTRGESKLPRRYSKSNMSAAYEKSVRKLTTTDDDWSRK